jgi:hypothetical protein
MSRLFPIPSFNVERVECMCDFHPYGSAVLGLLEKHLDPAGLEVLSNAHALVQAAEADPYAGTDRPEYAER